MPSGLSNNKVLLPPRVCNCIGVLPVNASLGTYAVEAIPTVEAAPTTCNPPVIDTPAPTVVNFFDPS